MSGARAWCEGPGVAGCAHGSGPLQQRRQDLQRGRRLGRGQHCITDAPLLGALLGRAGVWPHRLRGGEGGRRFASRALAAQACCKVDRSRARAHWPVRTCCQAAEGALSAAGGREEKCSAPRWNGETSGRGLVWSSDGDEAELLLHALLPPVAAGLERSIPHAAGAIRGVHRAMRSPMRLRRTSEDTHATHATRAALQTLLSISSKTCMGNFIGHGPHAAAVCSSQRDGAAAGLRRPAAMAAASARLICRSDGRRGHHGAQQAGHWSQRHAPRGAARLLRCRAYLSLGWLHGRATLVRGSIVRSSWAARRPWASKPAAPPPAATLSRPRCCGSAGATRSREASPPRPRPPGAAARASKPGRAPQARAARPVEAHSLAARGAGGGKRAHGTHSAARTPPPRRPAPAHATARRGQRRPRGGGGGGGGGADGTADVAGVAPGGARLHPARAQAPGLCRCVPSWTLRLLLPPVSQLTREACRHTRTAWPLRACCQGRGLRAVVCQGTKEGVAPSPQARSPS